MHVVIGGATGHLNVHAATKQISCHQNTLQRQNIQQLKDLLLLVVTLQLDVMLLQSEQSRFGFIMDVHFHRLICRQSEKGRKTKERKGEEISKNEMGSG